MRASFLVLTAAIGAVACATIQPAQADLHLADVVGHWKLDSAGGGTAVDSINGNNGTWQNGDATNLAWGTGVIGNAAVLDDAGGNDFFRIPAIPQLENGAGWTISVWIDPEPQSGYNGIFNSRTTNGGGSWGIALEGSGPFHTDNRMNTGGGLDSPDEILADGGWYHVANTWDAATGIRNAYINGALVSSSPADAANGNIGAITSSGSWDIGYDDCCGGSRDFDGAIDDLAMWKIPLADADIAEIYNNGLANKDALGNPGPLPPVDGDVNGDQIANDADYEIIRGAFYQSVTSRVEGDLNGDGFVDFVDFNEWKIAASSSTAAATGIPEPATLMLLLCTTAGSRVMRRRRIP
jgi:hypothetical protein